MLEEEEEEIHIDNEVRRIGARRPCFEHGVLYTSRCYHIGVHALCQRGFIKPACDQRRPDGRIIINQRI